MTNTLHNTVLGFCSLDIVAAIILIAVIVLFIVRHHKLNKRKEELEEMVADMSTLDTMANDNMPSGDA